MRRSPIHLGETDDTGRVIATIAAALASDQLLDVDQRRAEDDGAPVPDCGSGSAT